MPARLSGHQAPTAGRRSPADRGATEGPCGALRGVDAAGRAAGAISGSRDNILAHAGTQAASDGRTQVTIRNTRFGATVTFDNVWVDQSTGSNGGPVLTMASTATLTGTMNTGDPPSGGDPCSGKTWWPTAPTIPRAAMRPARARATLRRRDRACNVAQASEFSDRTPLHETGVT